MKHFQIYLIVLGVVLTACKSNKSLNTVSGIEVQGHRGDRGNFPENSIPAFISAVEKGVDVIELDVVISADKKVVVSHEPYMSSVYVTAPNGKPISKKQEHLFNLHTMNYDSISKFDIGSRGNPNFLKQSRIKTYKPLLAEVIDTVEKYIKNNHHKPVRYNIEIKSDKKEYGISQPQPEEFVDLVMALLKAKDVLHKINIQSFDPMPLNILRKKYPSVTIALLTSKPNIEKNLAQLDFTPEIYSPHYKLVTNAFCDSLRLKKIKIIPWTINDDIDIQDMIEKHVDGIITDYPERVISKMK
ncbi:glycerophosphodiester phosphodiesterase family protein [Flavobacterium agrisoli]|uniref:Glycerophosphodiester phosphodiesterase n=1 Tax=Flavobacterium agrisoli TaxID=2793066 RepID=A0A934PLU6_9FLAO|nr:glycerophosphodiester phosphodiesterase family protein [Flavobacterium agrisoli]MBK0369185.1 glycerophosphodiester phosphodiesterase [Flavobacterium agrisoli]